MILTRFARYLSPVALLLIMLIQMAAASPVQSAAFDEGYTVTYGYAYLRTGDIRLSRGQNPPLTNVLLALPLLLRDNIALPLDHPTWAESDIYGFADEFLWKANANPHRLVMLARLPEMALALLLACVVFAFTRMQFGERAALGALFLCAFDPNILAHGHIAGTDLGVTLFLLAAVWVWTSALRRMSLRRAIAAGLLGGAALASKYSAMWLAPMILVIGLVYPIETTKTHSRDPSASLRAGENAVSSWLRGKFAPRFRLWLVFGIAAFAVVWATFAFSVGPLTANGIPVPAPDYWASLGGVRFRVESGTPAFMLGQVSPTGFLLYYPFVFLVKTPLPTLLLAAIGIGRLIARRNRRSMVVWLPPALFLLVAMVNNLSLGYRLILPVLPFALMIAGHGFDSAAGWIANKERRTAAWIGAAAISILAVWLVLEALAVAPHHIAYFNPLIFDRDRDYQVLVDSNLDWGQDLISLREWVKAQNLDAIGLAYFGTARPEAYDVQTNLLPSFTLNEFGPEVDGFSAYALPPGWYAISATSLQLGLLYSHWDLYAPFRMREPDARMGRSILAYHVDYPSSEVDRAVVLGPVAGDLDMETLGGHPDRRLIVKWAGADAAVLDMQGRARYITRGGEPIAGFAPDVHDALIASAERLGSDASGALRLFEIDARQALARKIDSLAQARVETPGGRPLPLPIEFEGGLTLLGYDLRAEADRPIDLITYWRARHPAVARQTVFAHMLDRDNRLLTQGDGLNVRLSALEADDVILQHFAIDHPPDATALAIGLYDPATGRRFTLVADPAIDRVRVTLPGN
ncbi:MAG TPA: glycosyltransferase family 39 protein [Anaerolineae bacterium]|nr:glycosyltransferase family 39 protein [Anaerolineae bacterium]